MRKIVEIKVSHPYILICKFDNGETRMLNLEDVMDKNGPLSKKVFEGEKFKEARIGDSGEIFWLGIAEMKTKEGGNIPCEYDICPDFAYMKSIPISSKTPQS
ncbi:MAG: DUF2442 domain-containing protein [Saprospiraceae bacterium]